jgi:hypothetical protein
MRIMPNYRGTASRCLAAISGAKPRPPAIECRALTVVDEATGEDRIDLSVSRGHPSLLFYGRDPRRSDKPLISIGTSEKHGGLILLRDADGERPKVYGPED